MRGPRAGCRSRLPSRRTSRLRYTLAASRQERPVGRESSSGAPTQRLGDRVAHNDVLFLCGLAKRSRRLRGADTSERHRGARAELGVLATSEEALGIEQVVEVVDAGVAAE